MATRTVTAMFNDQAEAERAAQKLVGELGLDRAGIRVSPGAGASDTGYGAAKPYEETGFFGSLKDLFLPDEDRYAYAEGMRRGRVLLSAQVDEGQLDRAYDVLEHAGALDLDAQEAEWRRTGWTGYDAAAHGTVRTAATATATRDAGTDETLKVVEERLVVGKRMVEQGRVRVRAYVVERPVEERIVLRDETVHVERRPVDRPLTAADADTAFRDQVVEAREVDEEAVVSKEARVVEEIGLRRESSDRVETVRDTVRRTEVEVEDTTVTTRGASLGSDAQDGTPGNPPGTMASRAVDKTLGTNISGANPKK